MQKFPKPWYRPARGVWYVTLGGQQINLGPDKDQAFEKYKQLLARPVERELSSDSLATIVDAFLDWVQKNRSSPTYGWYQYRLERFVKKFPNLRAVEVRPFHAQQWVDGYKLSVTSRRNYLRTVKRCLAWATKQGYLEKNPVAYLEIPAAEHREVFVSQQEFDAILALVKDDAFRDLLIVTWETGCRPQESLRAEKRHFDLPNSRLVFPKSESKNKKTTRVVYLADRSLEIVKRLSKKHPRGKLFRNRRGKKWTTFAVNCRFGRIQKKLKKKYSLYALRHAWATNALQRGVDPLTVAILMGHSDPSMLSKVYQHLSLDPRHMLESAKRAVTV